MFLYVLPERTIVIEVESAFLTVGYEVGWEVSEETLLEKWENLFLIRRFWVGLGEMYASAHN